MPTSPGPGVADASRAFIYDQQPALWTPHRPVRPEKSEGGGRFKLVSDYAAAGDQPEAIAELTAGINARDHEQVLLGVTGSGKTFTMARIIEETQRPALILAHNKTLAAQLYSEFKSFFPENAVEYFVSYYDYYQPEAYVPRTDTYIEKDSSINEQIDRMRHSATRAILERDDVIVVASVSCIYGIGSVETYSAMTFTLKVGDKVNEKQLMADLVAQQYRRNDNAFERGTFRRRGDTIEIFPAHYEDRAWRVALFGDEIEAISEFDPLTGRKTGELKTIRVYANSHYVTPRPTLIQAVNFIKAELKERLDWLVKEGKLLEAQRLEQRTTFDLEMIEATGSCAGIENYSRYLTGRRPGEPPPTFFEYLPDNALLFVDECHQTVPQIGAMYRGDYRRKFTLAEYGFRLPSCMDNRPLKFEEWEAMRPDSVFVSATPAKWELDKTGGVFVEQVIRPTGLIDPPVEVRPVSKGGFSQVDDVIDECRTAARRGYRTLVTVLTKKMAEDLTENLHEQRQRVRYITLRHRHPGADRDHPRPAPRRLRRPGRDQPAARGAGHPRVRPGGDPRRRQGGLPALGDQPDPDHRPRRAQRGRQGDPLRRQHHRLDGAGDGRDQPPAREAGGVQHRARHHPGKHPQLDQGHPGQPLRARPGDHRRRRRRRSPPVPRPQLPVHPARPGKPHEEGGRGPGVRGSRPPARRGQAPEDARPGIRQRDLHPPGRSRRQGRPRPPEGRRPHQNLTLPQSRLSRALTQSSPAGGGGPRRGGGSTLPRAHLTESQTAEIAEIRGATKRAARTAIFLPANPNESPGKHF